MYGYRTPCFFNTAAERGKPAAFLYLRPGRCAVVRDAKVPCLWPVLGIGVQFRGARMPRSCTAAPRTAARLCIQVRGSSAASSCRARHSREMELSHSAASLLIRARSCSCRSARRAASRVWPMSSCTRIFIFRISSSRTMSGILSYKRFARRFASARRSFSCCSAACNAARRLTSVAITSVYGMPYLS